MSKIKFNEPWEKLKTGNYCQSGPTIVDSTDEIIVNTLCSECRGEKEQIITEKTADRIVACVNALAGIPDERIQATGELLTALANTTVQIKANNLEQQTLAELMELFLNHQK